MMLNKLKLHQSKRYQPSPRVGHESVVICDRLYIWGGWSKAIPKQHSNADKISALSLIDVFSFRSSNWDQIPTSGLPPLGVAYYSCTPVNEDIYYFGGRCGHGGCHHNTIHRLSTVTMKWRDATPPFNQSVDGPMKKAQCGMVHFNWKSEDVLLVMGGYGLLPVRHQPQATYIPKRGNPEYGWTNECHIFNIKQGTWIVPKISGEIPPPCSNFTMVSLGDNRGAMFGGFQPEGPRLSDVYIAEFTNNNIHWSKLKTDVSSPLSSKLKGSCDHSMTFISGYHSDRHSPCILVQGGENDESETLSDCWIMELQTADWKQVTLPPSVAGRMYHSVSSITLGPYSVLLVLFGGVRDLDDMKDWQEQNMVANTAIIEIVKRPGDLTWSPTVLYEASSPVKNSVEEYIKKLNDRMFQAWKDWLSLTNKNMVLLPASEESERANRAESRADWAEQQAAESRKKAEETETIITNVKETANKERRESVTLYTDLNEARKRALAAEKDLQRVNEHLLIANTKMASLEDQLNAANTRISELLQEGDDESSRLSDLKSSSVTSTDSGCGSVVTMATPPHWVVTVDELSEEVNTASQAMLVSSSGRYYANELHGTPISVKVLKRSATTLQGDFMKTANLISQLHHPNLLLFIGAMIGETPAIIYELLPSKPLNILLEEAPLSRTNMVRIGLDVSKAATYLHHQAPPIVHGCISSKVIFIESHSTTSLKAKLADTFLYPQYSVPVPAYTSPDSIVSPKMDVYAFGILVIEMYCRKALVSSQSDREKQVQHINWPEMVSIVKNCLHLEPNNRYTMITIFTMLKQLLPSN